MQELLQGCGRGALMTHLALSAGLVDLMTTAIVPQARGLPKYFKHRGEVKHGEN
jgi:hypothetical protein